MLMMLRGNSSIIVMWCVKQDGFRLQVVGIISFCIVVVGQKSGTDLVYDTAILWVRVIMLLSSLFLNKWAWSHLMLEDDSSL